MSRYFIAPEPAAESTPTYDYGSVYGNISTYLNQVRGELADINVDTTAIATSLGTMATNSTTMATQTTAIATSLGYDSTTISGLLGSLVQAIENVEKHQQRMRELAEGTGIHMVGPYDWLGLISSYIYYVNKGEILKTDENLSEADIARAFAELKTYFDKIKTLPTTFNTI